MEEVIFLFLYHKLDAVTLRHHQMLQQLHPRDQIIPVGYQLKVPEPIPGSVDVALDWDYGWPIDDIWPHVDKIYLRWFHRPNRPRARRYVFYEYDVLPKAPAHDFFGTTWNAEVAAVDIKTPDSDPAWLWWRHGSLLEMPKSLWQGLTPLAVQLWSDEALSRVANDRRFQRCYCELRLGTLAKMLGILPAIIPSASQTISWRAEDIKISDAPGWYHPVKG